MKLMRRAAARIEACCSSAAVDSVKDQPPAPSTVHPATDELSSVRKTYRKATKPFANFRGIPGDAGRSSLVRLTMTHLAKTKTMPRPKPGVMAVTVIPRLVKATDIYLTRMRLSSAVSPTRACPGTGYGAHAPSWQHCGATLQTHTPSEPSRRRREVRNLEMGIMLDFPSEEGIRGFDRRRRRRLLENGPPPLTTELLDLARAKARDDGGAP